MKHSHLQNFEEREKILPSREILTHFGLRAGQRLADLGCGYGFFALTAAEIVGPKGMVAAVDINAEGLDELQKRALTRKVDGTIKTYLSDGTNVPLPDEYFEIALIALVLHELNNPLLYLREAHRILVDGGQIWVIEWQKKEMTMGPPMQEKKSTEEWTALMTEAGFRAIKRLPTI
ncbi:MAG TPA: methyltransferase domain-containing protein [Spirochaetia bacterium]|nr:methyltransferase domain-containing protein [Spirochaetia bacterium]